MKGILFFILVILSLFGMLFATCGVVNLKGKQWPIFELHQYNNVEASHAECTWTESVEVEDDRFIIIIMEFVIHSYCSNSIMYKYKSDTKSVPLQLLKLLSNKVIIDYFAAAFLRTIM